MTRTRQRATRKRPRLRLVSRRQPAGARRTVTTVGDLVSAVYQVAGSTRGAARLLDASSPLGHLLDRRIIIG